MRIYRERHHNENCITMESDILKLKILPGIGFKMASISYKGNELLFQPTALEYKSPSYGGSFSDYDTSGLDDMLPSIDSCTIGEGIQIPDHGDVWSMSWETDIEEDSIIGKVNLRSLPFRLEKEVAIRGRNIITMKYRLINLSGEWQPYLWAMHGLNKFNEHTEIVLPDYRGRIMDVMGNREIDGNSDRYLKLSNYEDNGSYKYYLTDELQRGECGLHYRDSGIVYTIRFDKEKNPYLGIWITKGGFKGEYNCALEPSNGFYDDLSRAIRNGKCAGVGPHEHREWEIEIEIGDAG